MSNMKINVMVVDDHDLIREGLNRIISFEDDLIITDQYSNGEELLNNIKGNIPNVVLLDINMPVKNGLETLKSLKSLYKDIKVVMLTVENDKKTIMEAIDMGADAYILKESAGVEINNKEKEVLDLLTNRELNILFEISRGLKNKEIAKKLFLSEKTIKNYITSIFKKIGVEDRVQATIYAIRNNIDEFYKKKIN